MKNCIYYALVSKMLNFLVFTNLIASIQSDSSNEDLICENFFKQYIKSPEMEFGETWKPKVPVSDSKLYQDIHQDCTKFLFNQKYFLNLKETEDEENFRIAYSIVVFESASQLERLLRTIYRPWNYYCIHIDAKSSNVFEIAVGELVKCLHSKYKNIINSENRVFVERSTMSVLTADLNCMKELYRKFTNWKYFINLTGQEFPLKTNAELVKILKAYKGANNIEGTYKNRDENIIPKEQTPFPVIWFKGDVHIIVNRNFVEFIFESSIPKVILQFLNNQQFPDEQFFSTLNYNPQFRIAGSFLGDPDELDSGIFLGRYKNKGQFTCGSRFFNRSICILGIQDLNMLINSPHLFAHKFYEHFQPGALRCLEKWYYDKVTEEIKSGYARVKESFYTSQVFVKHQYVRPTL